MTHLTETHIKMFTEAKELQEGWTPEVGDRYALNDYTFFIIESTLHRFELTRIKEDFIFLPSIEQMAEMWHEAKGDKISYQDNYQFIRELQSFTYKEGIYFGVGWPLPIIVLAFIMKDLYGKIWSKDTESWAND